jgi:hypothetical protein
MQQEIKNGKQNERATTIFFLIVYFVRKIQRHDWPNLNLKLYAALIRSVKLLTGKLNVSFRSERREMYISASLDD